MNLSKYKNLSLTAADNLRRYKAKTISLVVPMILIMAVCSFMMFTRGGFIKDAGIARDFLPDITVQGIEAGRVATISLKIKTKIENIPHVKKIMPRVWGYIPLRVDDTDISYTLMGIDVDHMQHDMKIFKTLEEGFFLVPGDRHKAVLGYGVAQTYGFAVGDKFQIEQIKRWNKDITYKDIGDKVDIKDLLGNEGEFEIIGIFNNTVQLYSADLILVSNDDARKFFGYKTDEASDLLVYLDNPEYADNVAFAISQLFKNTRVMTRNALTNLVVEAFGRRGGTFQAMWLILLVTLMLLIWAQSAHISVDVGAETGILKAIGWQTGDIIIIKMIESLICGLLGTMTGMLAGFVYALMGTPGISGYCLGCASVYPKFPVPVSCDAGSIILIFLLGTVPVTVVSAIPAWLTGTIDPDDAIRS
ncbi:MAG: FtsX-like permease family protein [Deltaproteobacteria bacterium]|nr:FtsX-like permease family protein [Deltaproteobacteria bacterium]